MKPRSQLILLAAVTAAVIGLAVYVSFDQDYYFFRRPEARAAWTHPTGNVALVCLVVLVEACLIGYGLLASVPPAIWLRCRLALSLLWPWGLFTVIFTVHAPGYFHVHHLWPWLWILILSVVSLVTGTSAAMGALRRRSLT